MYCFWCIFYIFLKVEYDFYLLQKRKNMKKYHIILLLFLSINISFANIQCKNTDELPLYQQELNGLRFNMYGEGIKVTINSLPENISDILLDDISVYDYTVNGINDGNISCSIIGDTTVLEYPLIGVEFLGNMTPIYEVIFLDGTFDVEPIIVRLNIQPRCPFCAVIVGRVAWVGGRWAVLSTYTYFAGRSIVAIVNTSKLIGKATSTGLRISQKYGGWRRTLKDFNSMKLENVRKVSNKLFYGYKDGKKVTARFKSSDGRPTLEISEKVRNKTKKLFEIRYN